MNRNNRISFSLYTGILTTLVIIFFLLTCTDDGLASLSVGDEDWSFVVFGDLRFGDQVFQQLAINMSNVRPTPECAICLGDILIVNGNLSEWRNFWIHAAPITEMMPLYLVRGNHEGNENEHTTIMLNQIRINTGLNLEKLYYSIYKKDVCFIILDTDVLGEKTSIIGTQFKWLVRQLDSTAQNQSVKDVFICLHKQLYPQGMHKGNDLKNADELHVLFQKYNKLRAVLGAHDHMFHRLVKDNVNYIISGGAGVPLNNVPTGKYHHFLKISFYRSVNRVTLQTIGVRNGIIEEFDL